MSKLIIIRIIFFQKNLDGATFPSGGGKNFQVLFVAIKKIAIFAQNNVCMYCAQHSL